MKVNPSHFYPSSTLITNKRMVMPTMRMTMGLLGEDETKRAADHLCGRRGWTWVDQGAKPTQLFVFASSVKIQNPQNGIKTPKSPKTALKRVFCHRQLRRVVLPVPVYRHCRRRHLGSVQQPPPQATLAQRRRRTRTWWNLIKVNCAFI